MLNPRGVGDNINVEINYAAEEAERLRGEYAEMTRTIESLEQRSEALPEEVTAETKPLVASLIKDARDADKRVDGFRELEKMPFFRKSQGVDQFFFGLSQRLFRRNRKDRPGLADTWQDRLTAYDTKLLREEQERRRREAEEAARLQRETEARYRQAAAEAEERRLAAERARTPATTETKQEAARQAEGAASQARVDAQIAEDVATEARLGTYARPAEIMRQRGDDGILTTMKRENYAEVTDEALLDKAALWPFIPIEAKEKALRAWAKTTGHRQQMPGAAIGDRPKSVVR